MLTLADQNEVRRVMDKLIQVGSVQQRCGVAQYADKFERASSEAILGQLMQVDQRQVRLCASGMLSRLQQQWLKNPPGFIEKRLEPGTMTDDEFFSPPGASVVVPLLGTHQGVDRPTKDEPVSRIDAVPADPAQPNKIACVIRGERPAETPKSIADDEDLVAVWIDGVLPATGKTVYSRELIVAENAWELRWLYCPENNSMCVSVPGFTYMIDCDTGQTIWEMGFGTGNGNELSLIQGYLIIHDSIGNLVICDAARGGIVAYYGARECFDRRISMVEGRLRAKDYAGALYVLKLPDLAASADAPSPAVQTPQ